MLSFMQKLSVAVLILSTLSCATKREASPMKNLISPPKPMQVSHEMTLHQDKRNDPYFWMKERDSERVLNHLKSENEYYEKSTADWKPLQDKIYTEMRARVKEDDSTPPYKKGVYYYYARYETGKEYPIYCRRMSLKDIKTEQIMLDVNKLAVGQKYTQVADVEPSHNHEWMAYGVDYVGRRFYDIHFVNLKTGEVSDKVIPKTTSNFVWANDNRTLYYTQQNPETLRAERVFKFDLVTGKSEEIYYEKDEIFSVAVSKSLTGKYLYLHSESFDSTEIRFLETDHPDKPWKMFLPREAKHEYSVEDGGDGFYITTNWQAENFRVMKADYKNTAKDSWKEVIPHQKTVLISSVLMLKNHMVVSERENGLTALRVIDRSNMKGDRVPMPDPVYVVSIGTNEEYNASKLRFNYQSLVLPSSVYDYDLKSKKLDLIKRTEVPTFDASKYVSERKWAVAFDGTKVPISLVYKKGLAMDGTAPTLLYGYGSYGHSIDPSFRISIFSLLDRGFVYAIAHPRGGSEMGRYWYEQGRMGFKKNTFTDFNSCAEYLISEKISHPKKMFAMGGSAGGLLMGAIVNLKPELYRGIVSVVPFVDVLTTMLDPDIPLTTAEYEQWGNPNEKQSYEYIKSYSPYDNITKKNYPAMLVMTGYHDSQVQYWEPAKYVAKVRDNTTSGQPILFRVDMEAGHAGASGRFQALRDMSLEYGFILKFAGINE